MTASKSGAGSSTHQDADVVEHLLQHQCAAAIPSDERCKVLSKCRAGQAGLRQRKRRTCTRSRTERFPMGTSVTVRT
jgi:hypothetical protein